MRLLSKQWLIISTWKRFCISAASQSTACLSLYQSKDNEGSPHCNYPTMNLSVTSHAYEWERGGGIKVFGLNLPGFLTWERENGPGIIFVLSKSPEGESFSAFVCQSFPVMTGWVQHVEGVEGVRDWCNRFEFFSNLILFYCLKAVCSYCEIHEIICSHGKRKI